jgi:hypothetical protein
MKTKIKQTPLVELEILLNHAEKEQERLRKFIDASNDVGYRNGVSSSTILKKVAPYEEQLGDIAWTIKLINTEKTRRLLELL